MVSAKTGETLKSDLIPGGIPEELLGAPLVSQIFAFTVNLLSNLWYLQ